MIESRRGVAYFEGDPMVDKFIETMYLRAQEEIIDMQIDMDEFRDLYGEVGVKKDQEYVAQMEKQFSQETDAQRERSKKLATIFEVIIDNQIEQNEWLGSGAYTIKASKYDDIRNGVDTIVEFDRDEGVSHLALAIDVTYSSDAILKKLKKIKSDIETGRLTQIKYFESENLNFRGEINNIPKLIVGADIESVKELMELFEARNNKELKNHKVKIQTIEMMRMQLEAYRDYASHVGQKGVEKIYQRYLDMINKIMAQQKIEMIGQYFKGDKVYQALKNQLKSLNQ